LKSFFLSRERERERERENQNSPADCVVKMELMPDWRIFRSWCYFMWSWGILSRGFAKKLTSRGEPSPLRGSVECSMSIF
jgi:hypothetical protein